MKRIMLVVLFALLAVAMASAQAIYTQHGRVWAHIITADAVARAAMLPTAADAAMVATLVAGSGVNTLGGAEGDYHLLGSGRIVDHPGNPAVRRRLWQRRRWLHCQLCCRPVDSFVPASNFGHRFLPELP